MIASTETAEPEASVVSTLIFFIANMFCGIIEPVAM